MADSINEVGTKEIGDNITGGESDASSRAIIIGVSAWATQMRAQIARLASRNLNVLIVGPTGAGKEMIARSIHEQGERSSQPFMLVDCAAASSDQFGEQLFGSVARSEQSGKFAVICDSHGAFRAADRGTIFLDEIGDLDLACQSKLLRAIEQRTITPVGGHEEIAVDVRVLASTHRNLSAEVAAGRFRADLFYRLRVVTLEAAALTSRKEDIAVLAYHFLQTVAAENNESPRTLSEAALAELSAHAWPGNVRELRNTIELAVAFAEGSTIEAGIIEAQSAQDSYDRLPAGQILPFAGKTSVDAATGSLVTASAELENANSQNQPFRMLTAAQTERIQILTAMQIANYNQSHAATLLGVTRQQLRRRIAKHFPDSLPAKRGRPRTPKAA